MSPICHSALARVREAPRASPEVEVLECEVGFYDASGFDPGSEDILLGGLVVGGPNPIQAVQVAGEGNTQGPWNKPARPQAAPPGGRPWKRRRHLIHPPELGAESGGCGLRSRSLCPARTFSKSL